MEVNLHSNFWNLIMIQSVKILQCLSELWGLANQKAQILRHFSIKSVFLISLLHENFQNLLGAIPVDPDDLKKMKVNLAEFGSFLGEITLMRGRILEDDCLNIGDLLREAISFGNEAILVVLELVIPFLWWVSYSPFEIYCTYITRTLKILAWIAKHEEASFFVKERVMKCCFFSSIV